MADISITEFKSAIINDSVITAANAEVIIDSAIDDLNVYLEDEIPNMTGAAGSKTWSGTSRQKGAIITLAHAKYKLCYKGFSGANLGAFSLTPNHLQNNEIMELAKNLATSLKEMNVSLG